MVLEKTNLLLLGEVDGKRVDVKTGRWSRREANGPKPDAANSEMKRKEQMCLGPFRLL